MAMETKGTPFLEAYYLFQEEVKQLLDRNQITLPEATTRLVEYVQDVISLEGPVIIVALSGPYYPHVNNKTITHKLPFDLEATINQIASEKYNLVFESQGYFMGISDLSYATWCGDKEDIKRIKNNSPGWDVIYKIPFKALSTLEMPVINLGPWGKDLHKITERVYKKDVYERMPYLIKELMIKVFE
jgi:arginine utilization protein RocB